MAVGHVLLLLLHAATAGAGFGRKEGVSVPLHDASATAVVRKQQLGRSPHEKIVFPVQQLKEEGGCPAEKGDARAECLVPGEAAASSSSSSSSSSGSGSSGAAPPPRARRAGCMPERKFATVQEYVDLALLSAPLYASEPAFVCGMKCADREPHLERKMGPFWDARLDEAAFAAECYAQTPLNFQTVAFAVSGGELYFHPCRAGTDLQLSDLAEVATLIAMVLKLVAVPDCRLVFHGGDAPLHLRHRAPPYPVGTWTTSDMHWEVAWPSGQLVNGVMSPKRFEPVAWARKAPKVFWRGGLTGQDNTPHWAVALNWRLQFVREAQRLHPEGFDVGITAVDTEAIAPADEAAITLSGYVDPASFSHYKWLANPDGVSSAWRLAELLHANSTLLKPDSPIAEYVEDYLAPYVHYVPVRGDSADLNAKYEWLRAHDADAERIATRALHLFEERLRPQDVLCYVYRLLRTLAMHATPMPSTEQMVAKGWRRVPFAAELKNAAKSAAAMKKRIQMMGPTYSGEPGPWDFAVQAVMAMALEKHVYGGKYQEAVLLNVHT